jgi:N-acyl-D-aspartate/D-glutamate deacylase
MARRPEAGPDSVIVSSVSGKPEYEGKTLTQIAEMLDVAPDEAAQRVLEADPSAVAVFFMMDEADVRRVLAHPLCMIGSDGIPSPTGKPHPRLYGTFPRVLGAYVREEMLFSLEEGVRKMTSLPARRLNLRDRGLLRAGMKADLVVFDPATVRDTATFEKPMAYPEGIPYVVVNGRLVLDNGKRTRSRPGRPLLHSP